MENKLKNSPKILGLDVSTKCIGWAIFELNGSKLLEASHFSPKIKPEPENKLEVLIMKSEIFKKHLLQYKDIGITCIVIEEPLLQSNNIYTVGTLIRFNTMVMKSCYDIFQIVPHFISTYNARRYAFPDLVGENDKGKKVLFGGYPRTIDKKQIIWEHVNAVCPEVKWLKDKNGKNKKENYDTADAITCVIGYVNMIKQDKQ
jgi:hypothetical protein